MASMGETIKVSGIALRAGISRNNVLYTASEMMKTSNELANKPFLMDHESKSTGVIGRTTFSRYLDTQDAIYYEGWIKETGLGIVEAIKDGRLDTVSIGAMCDEVLEDEDRGYMIARGIHYLELSTTPTPGVNGTSLTQAINNSQREGVRMKAFNENINNISLVESATDTSLPLMNDSKQGTIPVDNSLRLKCPSAKCDGDSVTFDNIEVFEQHMMIVHGWTDSKVDDYLRQAGIVNPEEEKNEPYHKDEGQNPATDIGKNEQPAKDNMFQSQNFNTTTKESLVNDIKGEDKKNNSGENKMAAIQEKKEILPDKTLLKGDEEEELEQSATKVVDGEEEEEEECEENPVAYKADDMKGKGYQPGTEPKVGKIARTMPYDKVSASVESLSKKLQSRDLVIENLAKEIEALKNVKKDVQEKGQIDVKEVYSGNVKTYEVESLRFERLDNGKWSFWKMPKGTKGQL